MSVWLIVLYVLAGRPETLIEKVASPEACEMLIDVRVKELAARTAQVIREASGCLFVKDEATI